MFENEIYWNLIFVTTRRVNGVKWTTFLSFFSHFIIHTCWKAFTWFNCKEKYLYIGPWFYLTENSNKLPWIGVTPVWCSMVFLSLKNFMSLSLFDGRLSTTFFIQFYLFFCVCYFFSIFNPKKNIHNFILL